MKKVYELLCVVWCVMCVCTIQAQEKTKEKSEKEIQEYIEYVQKLVNFKSTQGKSVTSGVIPRPLGLDPAVAFGGVQGNRDSWELYHKTVGNEMAKEKALHNASFKEPVVIIEKELLGRNSNDLVQGAEQIPNFGTEKHQVRKIHLNGVIVEKEILANPTILREEVGDNDALQNAESITIDSEETIKISASLENKMKSGGLSGDVDIYELFLEEGKRYVLKIEKSGIEPFQLSTRFFYEDGSSALLYSFSDGFTHIFPEDGPKGKVKLAIYSSGSFVSKFAVNDPERVHAVDGEFKYDLIVREMANTSVDKDLYKISLKKGDVFGLSGKSEFLLDQIALANLEIGSFIGIQDNKYAIEVVDGSPLPTKGTYGFHYVIPEDGVYVLSVEGELGAYAMELGVSRSGVEENKKTNQQVIFLNMSGAAISRNDFFKNVSRFVEDAEVKDLSRLGSFMSKWDLDENKELRSLAKKITHNVTRKLRAEVSRKNINPDFGVIIMSDLGSSKRKDKILKYLNKEEIAYSQVIIGGTILEFEQFTIGVATGVDVGNFDLSDNAIVLLDVLSEETTDSNQSINNIPLAEGAEKIDLVAEVIGNIAVHEVGHLLGNFHTEESNDVLSIMDLGDDIASFVGVLEGDAYGDKENVKISFVNDEYAKRERFLIGRNETVNNTAFALTSSKNYGRKDADGLITFMNKLDGIPTASTFPIISSYPNPQRVTDTSTLTVNLEADSFLKVSLFDMQGRKISDLFTGDIQADQPVELAVNPTQYNLKSGVYLYKIISNAGQKSHKLIID